MATPTDYAIPVCLYATKSAPLLKGERQGCQRLRERLFLSFLFEVPLEPCVEIYLAEAPGAADFNRGNFAILRPGINRRFLELQIICYLFNGHQCSRHNCTPYQSSRQPQSKSQSKSRMNIAISSALMTSAIDIITLLRFGGTSGILLTPRILSIVCSACL